MEQFFDSRYLSKLKIYLALGLPASGKSTILKSLNLKHFYSEDKIKLLNSIDEINQNNFDEIGLDYLFTSEEDLIQLSKRLKNITEIKVFVSYTEKETCLKLDSKRKIERSAKQTIILMDYSPLTELKTKFDFEIELIPFKVEL